MRTEIRSGSSYSYKPSYIIDTHRFCITGVRLVNSVV